MRSDRQPSLPVLALLLAALGALVVRFWWWSPSSFEAMRFARNLGLGRGLRFDSAGPVEVPDTPAWVALGAAAQALGADPMWILPATTALATAAVVLLATRIAVHRLGLGSDALLAAAVVALCPATAVWASSGLPAAAVTLCTLVLLDRVALARTPGVAAALCALLLPLLGSTPWALAALAAGGVARRSRAEPLGPLLPAAAAATLSIAGLAAAEWAVEGPQHVPRLRLQDTVDAVVGVPLLATVGAAIAARGLAPPTWRALLLLLAAAPACALFARGPATFWAGLLPALPALALLLAAAAHQRGTPARVGAAAVVAGALLGAVGVDARTLWGPSDFGVWSEAQRRTSHQLEVGHALREAGYGAGATLSTLARGPLVYAADLDTVPPGTPADLLQARIQPTAAESAWAAPPDERGKYRPAHVPTADGRFLHALVRNGSPVPQGWIEHSGRWRKARAQPALTQEQRDEIEALAALGYLDGVEPMVVAERIQSFDPERAHHGRNLYVSGHAPEALLTDMVGEPLHRWHVSFGALWPDLLERSAQDPTGHTYWRRVLPVEDGRVIAMFEPYGIFELDAQSRVIWAVANGAHHDLHVHPDTGHLWTLVREAGMMPEVHPTRPILEDYVVELDRRADGRELRRFSVREAIVRSPFAGLMEQGRQQHGDLLHTNALWFIDGPATEPFGPWRRGNLLVSARALDAVMVIDPQTEAVVWAQRGPWVMQHDPTLLPDGSLLVFDNAGAPRNQSRVVRMDRASRELLWTFEGRPEFPFHTMACGTVKQLPNDNLLVVESNNGRAFELAPNDDVVWSFHSPHRAASNDSLVATLFDVIRMPPDWGDDWIDPGTLERTEPAPTRPAR